MEVLQIAPKLIEYVFGEDGETLNPRRHISLTSLHGDAVEVPLEVYCKDSAYYLLSGHRRLRWAISRRFETVPVVVVPEPPSIADKLLRVMQGNNYEPFSPLEKAKAVRQLATMGKSWSQIACATGDSIQTVQILGDLFDADPKIQKAVEDGRLSLTAWDKIRKESAERQVEILDKAEKASRGRVTTTAVRKARDEIAAEENGKPVLGDESVIEQWNTVKATIAALLDIPVPAGDERRIAYVRSSIVEMLS